MRNEIFRSFQITCPQNIYELPRGKGLTLRWISLAGAAFIKWIKVTSSLMGELKSCGTCRMHWGEHRRLYNIPARYACLQSPIRQIQIGGFENNWLVIFESVGVAKVKGRLETVMSTETWQLNAMHAFELDPLAVNNVMGAIWKIWIGCKD